MMRLCQGSLVLLIVAVLLAGCGSRSPLDGLKEATLRPGYGLADLELGLTTLEEYVSRYGRSYASGLFSDDLVGLEYVYGREGMAFLFLFDEPCSRRLLRESTARELTAFWRDDVDGFLHRFPECRGTPLHSIDITGGRKPEAPFWTGATDRGLRINSLADEARNIYGEASRYVGGGLRAGSDAFVDSRFEPLHYADLGLTVWLLEATGGPNRERLVVQRMTLTRLR